MPEEKTTTAKEIQIIDEDSIRDKIHVIRGVKVMLDYDLAQIYGYDTRSFNQQVKRNKDKFDEDFCFRLKESELDIILKSQIVISSWGSARKRLYQTSPPHWLQCRRRHRQIKQS